MNINWNTQHTLALPVKIIKNWRTHPSMVMFPIQLHIIFGQTVYLLSLGKPG
jgi:hypothetical protein